ncbi:MAG: hypothetical protein VCD00_06455 [Candidatus Hydrogenedentota bacterium]
MNKQYTITKILVSPKVGLLVDDDTARNMLAHLDQMVTQPATDLDFSHGPAKSWGIELAADDDSDRNYRVAFVVEERNTPPHEETYLTMVSVEEGTQLEIAPQKRETLENWRLVTP